MYYGKATKYKYNLLYSKFSDENPASDLTDVPPAPKEKRIKEETMVGDNTSTKRQKGEDQKQTMKGM